MIVGIVGFIGSGKDTFADRLVTKYGFVQKSFADTLKAAIAEIFSWEPELLAGKTKESREWREQVDKWWSNRLNISNLTPRWVLQQWGTELGRQKFHNDIWVASLERKLMGQDKNVVISDCRFPNELAALRGVGASIVRTKRGPDPDWYDEALYYAKQGIIPEDFHIHYSEWAWLNEPMDMVIENNSTLDNFYFYIDNFIREEEILNAIFPCGETVEKKLLV